MKIFNRRNALVGYVALKALKLQRKRKQRNALKIAAFAALAIVSVGILAAVVAVAIRRSGSAEEHEPATATAESVTPGSAVAEPGLAE